MVRVAKWLGILAFAALAVVAIAAVVYWLAVHVPPWFVDATDLDSDRRLELENDVRGTVFAFVAGVLFLVTAVLTWRQRHDPEYDSLRASGTEVRAHFPQTVITSAS